MSKSFWNKGMSVEQKCSSRYNTPVYELMYDHFAPAFLFWSKTSFYEGSPELWVVKMTPSPVKQIHACLCSPHIIYDKKNHNIKTWDFPKEAVLGSENMLDSIGHIKMLQGHAFLYTI